MRPVFVTGYGVVSGLGLGAELHLDRLRSGLSGISLVERDFGSFYAGLYPTENSELSQRLGLDPDPYISRTALLGLLAAKEALCNHEESFFRSCAFLNGTTVGGMDLSENYFADKKQGKLGDARLFQMHDLGSVTRFIARNLGSFDLINTVSTACSSGANAIMLGAQLIASGQYERAVVGGTESFCRFTLEGFKSLMVYDTQRCQPFDLHRRGLNLGEGAGFLVLESERSLQERGIVPQAMLSGWANRNDAFHQTGTSPEGIGAQQAMQEALETANLQTREIDYINAHGTGTPTNDSSELAAMQAVFGDQIPYFSSTKGSTGHTLGASGAIEAVVTLECIRTGFAPGTIGLEIPLDATESLLAKGRALPSSHVLSNSFGFGGNSTSLVFSKV